MTKYEMLYIIDASLADEAKEAIIKKFESLVTDNGGVVEQIDRWGVKKLQYPINYKTEGYYVLMNFEAAKTLVEEIKRIAYEEAENARNQARDEATKTRQGADLYAEKVLTKLEMQLAEQQQEVKNGQIYLEKMRTEALAGYESNRF